MLLIALSSIACRQDEVLQENEEITSSMSDATIVARDSIPSTGISDPPPKDKDHWKTTSEDTIKTPPKVIDISAFGSNFDIAIIPTDENGPKDPPKDKDHWRTK
ncbi:hypothetical protein [Chryseobacterium luquanense]|uniref:Uncharacterized protein n=1 Tax=Chryseobacterium luquanense TaxID=2983766 RepID=A0ABT3Y2Q4_9FLAO|nr:hypothetical protein [Chryseobacterium luquanense]MCX8532400.1 hypothetical protein [Chryseobacterium luquanense]